MILEVFDDISEATFKRIVEQTKSLQDNDDVTLLISSYGGEILYTMSIIDVLKRFNTHAHIIGFACSAAAILALSCKLCTMSDDASMMIHSAWAEDTNSDDAGIKHCNNLQLKVIRQRCPDFDSSNIKSDTWLTATECRALNLIDQINDTKLNHITALCNKYKAKEVKLMSDKKVTQETINEVIEEAAEVATEAPVEDSKDLIDVIEKLTEEMNALKARVLALEEVEDEKVDEVEAEADCSEDKEQERINALYKSIVAHQSVVAPQACISIGAPKASMQKVINKVDYKSYKSFING